MRPLATVKEIVINVSALLTMLLILLLTAALPYNAQAQATRYVAVGGSDSGPNDCLTSGSPCATIQHAIDQATPGETVLVGPGSYLEDLSIVSKDGLVLASTNGRDATTIEGVNTHLVAGGPYSQVDLRSNEVKIYGFTFLSPNAASGMKSEGIILGGVDIEIYDNRFVTRMQKVGVPDAIGETSTAIQTRITEDVSGLHIHDNIFEGMPLEGYLGVYINPAPSPTTDVIVEDNEMTGTIWRGITTEADRVIIRNNHIETDTDPATFSGNSGIRVVSWVTPGENVDDVLIEGNTVTGASLASGFGFALLFGGGDATTTFTNITVDNNDVAGNFIGARINESGDGITFRVNDFSSNTSLGLGNLSGLATSAILNYWGAEDGPSGAAGGSGSAVSADVEYDPWLVNGTDENFGDPGFEQSLLTIAGTISNDGAPLNAVDVTLTGNHSAETFETSTDGSGSYSFADIPYYGDYAVTPSKTGFTFVPTTANITDLSDDLTLNFVTTDGDPVDISIDEQATLLDGGDTHTTTIDGYTVTIEVPNGAISGDTEIHFGTFDTPPPGAEIYGTLFYFGPAGQTFDPPGVTITIEYDDTGFTPEEEEDLIRLVRFDESTGMYEVVENQTIDTNLNLLTGTGILSFSGFGAGNPADLAIEINPEFQSGIAVNTDATFFVDLINLGPNDVINGEGEVTFTALDGGLAFRPSTPPFGTFDHTTGLWTGIDIAAGDTLTFQLDVRPTTLGSQRFEGEITGSSGPDPDHSNNVDRATVNPDLDLEITKHADDELPFVGNTITFSLEVTNHGPGDAFDVLVSDPVPPGFVYLSQSDTTYDDTTGVWTIGDLAAGESASIQIAMEVRASSVLVNTATISFYEPAGQDTDTTNNVAKVTIVPQEQETFWTPANPVVGTTTSLAFINSLPKAGGALSGTLFAGADGGGVHRSTDAGENWFPVANDIEGTNVRGLASGNDDVLWALLYGDGIRGGAWRSDDAASNFTQTFANTIAATQKDSLLSIAINTLNEENAAGDGDVFLGSDGYGVFVSINDGASWVRIGSTGANPLPSNARVIRAIDIDEDGAGAGLDRVYIGTHGRGVWRVDYSFGPTAPTATSDWTAANGTGNELGSAVVNDVHVDQATDRLWAATDIGVWYSDDAGVTWTQSLRDETYLTMNGDPLSATITGRSVITYECKGDDYVLAGTDGDFVWRSDDDGATWTRFTGLMPVNNTVSGLRDGTILTLAYFGTSVDGFVYAGTQDQAVHRSDDCGETWNQVSKAEIAAIIQDMVFDNSGTVERLYAGTFGYGVLVSSEFDAASTLTWTRINRGLTNHLVYAMERIPNPGGSNDVILAGTWGGGVFRTVDGGENWFHMGLPNRVIYDLLYNAGNGFLYATMDRGQVARSIDRGITWQLIGVATNALWSIVADGNDPNTLYVGTFGAGIFKSTNAGLNFDETTLQVGHIFDFAWGQNPETGNDAIFAATSIGVKYTEDGGSTWHDFNNGLTVTDVRTIIFAGSHLLCGTWGGGAYVYDDAANSWVRDGLPATNLVAFVINPDTGDLYATSGEGGLFKKHIPGSKVVTDTEDPSKNELPTEYALNQNYPNPFNPSTQIEFALPQAGDVRIAVYDAVGRQVEVLVNGTMPAGRHAIDFEAGHLSSGVYFYRLETRAKIMTQKMVLMK